MNYQLLKELNIPPREYGLVNLGRLVLEFCFEWGVLAIGGIFVVTHATWGVLAGWILFSIHQHRLALLGHDGAHFRFSSNKPLNDLISNVFIFYPLGVTVQGYRHHHFEHHRKTGLPSDPEKFFKRGRNWERPFSRGRFFVRFLMDLIGLGSYELMRLIYSIRTNNKKAIFGLLIFWSILILVFWQFNLQKILIVYGISFFTGFWALFRVRGFTEHVGITGTYRYEVSGILRYAFFPYYTWCHYEHHEWPHVSYQNLAKSREFDRKEPVLTLSQLFDELGKPPHPI